MVTSTTLEKYMSVRIGYRDADHFYHVEKMNERILPKEIGKASVSGQVGKSRPRRVCLRSARLGKYQPSHFICNKAALLCSDLKGRDNLCNRGQGGWFTLIFT